MTRTDVAHWLGRVAERLGVPCALLGALMVALWYGAVWFADHVAEPIVDSHLHFLKVQIEVSRRNADALEQLVRLQADQNESIEELSDRLAQRARCE